MSTNNKQSFRPHIHTHVHTTHTTHTRTAQCCSMRTVIWLTSFTLRSNRSTVQRSDGPWDECVATYYHRWAYLERIQWNLSTMDKLGSTISVHCREVVHSRMFVLDQTCVNSVSSCMSTDCRKVVHFPKCPLVRGCATVLHNYSSN